MGKLCDECGGIHYAKGKCKFHYRMPSQLNPKKIEVTRKPIAHFSDKKLSELKVYRVLRDDFLKDKICQYPKCTSVKVVLHHAAGRIGPLLIDVRHFRALCEYHHRIVEENPTQAKLLGLSVDRLSA